MTMMIDMTAQLAPMIWALVAVLAVSATAIAAEVLPRLLRQRPSGASSRPVRLLPRPTLSSNPGVARC